MTKLRTFRHNKKSHQTSKRKRLHSNKHRGDSIMGWFKGCTKPITEECRLHPVDCDNCQFGDTCQMRPYMTANKLIKRCRFFRRKESK